MGIKYLVFELGSEFCHFYVMMFVKLWKHMHINEMSLTLCKLNSVICLELYVVCLLNTFDVWMAFGYF